MYKRSCFILGKKFTYFDVNLDGLDKQYNWYTLVTQTNYELKVSNSLRQIINNNNEFIKDSFLPFQQYKEISTNKKNEQKIKYKYNKIMTDYVFVQCKMNVTTWNNLLNITGVKYILCISGTPVSLSSNELKNIQNKCIEKIINNY